MPFSSSLSLNFGVEFEFYVAIPTKVLSDIIQAHKEEARGGRNREVSYVSFTRSPSPHGRSYSPFGGRNHSAYEGRSRAPYERSYSPHGRGHSARGRGRSPDALNLVSDDDDIEARRRAVQWMLVMGFDDAGLPINKSTALCDLDDDSYSRWSLKRDGSIKVPPTSKQRKGHAYFTFELVSRVLPLNDLEYTNDTHPPKHRNKSGQGIEEVRRALKFMAESKILTFGTNASCGFHVHIGLAPRRSSDGSAGKGPGKAYKLKAVQNLSALATIFEPYVNLILNDDRKSNSYCQTPSETTGLKGLNLKSQLIKIYGTEDLIEIQDVMNPGAQRYHSLNFTNQKQKGSKTVEFRQHHGTLDVNSVTAWCQILAGFMRLAHTDLSQERLANWRRRVEQNDMSPSEFLRKIEKPHLIEYYRGVRHTKSVKR